MVKIPGEAIEIRLSGSSGGSYKGATLQDPGGNCASRSVTYNPKGPITQ